MLPGGGAKAVDSWLAQNVRACSQQEYLRYREYLEAASPASAKEFEE
ncbi:MAG: hypothetical protein RBR29_02735 [Castellaniella sp.]|nr:hypothetical protein [Castellaniella sp.]